MHVASLIDHGMERWTTILVVVCALVATFGVDAALTGFVLLTIDGDAARGQVATHRAKRSLRPIVAFLEELSLMGTKEKNSRVEQDRSLDEALEQTFPASDPIAIQQAGVIGGESKTSSAGKVADKKTTGTRPLGAKSSDSEMLDAMSSERPQFTPTHSRTMPSRFRTAPRLCTVMTRLSKQYTRRSIH